MKEGNVSAEGAGWRWPAMKRNLIINQTEAGEAEKACQ